MIAFAANSLLCRAALRGGAIDAVSFTAVRFISGALVLVVITRAVPGEATEDARSHGSWRAAAALAIYAITFSYAYLGLGAGAGALLLFGSVQLTMIAGGLIRGERPPRRQAADHGDRRQLHPLPPVLRRAWCDRHRGHRAGHDARCRARGGLGCGDVGPRLLPVVRGAAVARRGARGDRAAVGAGDRRGRGNPAA